MKNILFYCGLAILAVTSCVSPYYDPDESNIDIENLINITSYEIPVKSGYTTYVIYQGDTIAIDNQPTTIPIPATAVQTKSEEDQLRIVFKEGLDSRIGSWQLFQTIAFEDSRNGDYDYNDLVIHTKYAYNRYTGIHKVGVHPIALGSTKQIGLGYLILSGNKVVANTLLTDNCRRDLFEDIQGYINTKAFTKRFIGYTIKESNTLSEKPVSSSLSIIWYIIVDQGTLYAVNSKYSCLDLNDRPYGLVVTDTGRTYKEMNGATVGANWFSYPIESFNISDCYPLFDSWLQGGVFSYDGCKDVFDINDSSDGDNRRLYTIPTEYNVL